jgi:hypothetical protein
MTFEEQIFGRHVGKKLILDSNLLLLLLIGDFEPALIKNFKRTARYSLDHHEALVQFLGSFSGVLTTPHILTEVGNLANSLPEWQKTAWGEYFSLQIAHIEEIYRASSDLAQDPGFPAYGLTDIAMGMIANQALVLTDDRRFAGYLRSLSRDVLDFNDLFEIRKALATWR